MVVSCRFAVCIGMSYFGGLTNRIAYAPTRWVLLRDLNAAALENNLVLTALEVMVVVLEQSSPPRSSVKGGHNNKRIRQQWGYGYKSTRLKRMIQRCTAAFLSVTWTIASWGDYVFESETRGLIPTMWVIAPGLKDPTVHAGVQLRNHRNIFVGGLVRCILGLCIGIVYALVVHKLCIRRNPSAIRPKGYSMSRSRHKSLVMHSGCSFRGLSDFLRHPKMIGWNVALLVFSFWSGAWAPLTNLMYCIVGILLLTPPGGGMMKGTSVFLSTRRGSLNKAKQRTGAGTPPNVVVVVHESLSGAAMQSATGIHAAPFFHSMRSNPNFYDFKYARTTAATVSEQGAEILYTYFLLKIFFLHCISRSSPSFSDADSNSWILDRPYAVY